MILRMFIYSILALGISININAMSLFKSKTKCVDQPIKISYSIRNSDIKISIVNDDITKQKADIIVNAANSALQHGGGVAKAISNAAGPELQKYSTQYTKTHGALATGGVCTTPAFNLKNNGIQHIIHAVGPRGSDANREELLRNTYQNILQEASKLNAQSIAIPSISTAIFGYNAKDATPIALASVIKYILDNKNSLKHLKEITFVLYEHQDKGAAMLALYEKTLDKFYGDSPENFLQDPIHSNNKKENQIKNQSIMRCFLSPKFFVPTIVVSTAFGIYLWWKHYMCKKNKKLKNQSNQQENIYHAV